MTLDVGDYAKLRFTQKGKLGSERMWVKVTRIGPGGSYSGTLANDPVVVTNVRHGSRVRFRSSQVLDTGDSSMVADDGSGDQTWSWVVGLSAAAIGIWMLSRNQS